MGRNSCLHIYFTNYISAGFLEYQYGLAFQVGSRYTSVFNDAISSLRDDGSLQELEEKWFTFRQAFCIYTQDYWDLCEY